MDEELSSKVFYSGINKFIFPIVFIEKIDNKRLRKKLYLINLLSFLWIIFLFLTAIINIKQ